MHWRSGARTSRVALVVPCPNQVRVWAVIAHGLTQGVTGSVVLIFLIQCLKRGTSAEGQARALQFAYSVGPLMAVAGSQMFKSQTQSAKSVESSFEMSAVLNEIRMILANPDACKATSSPRLIP